MADDAPAVVPADSEPEAVAGEAQLAAKESSPTMPADPEPPLDAALDKLAEEPDAIAPEAALVNGAQTESAPPALSSAEREELNLRIQALMADMHALQEQLRRRGLLDADWQPPSWAMQLPGSPQETPAEEVNR
jgi:hypothetical protein